MENSYRALMMAGGVLLGVFLLSSFVYMFRAGARMSKNYDEEQAAQQAILANSKFEFYNRGDSSTNNSDEQNTISDMITLINLVYANNKDGYESNRIDLEIELPRGTLTISKDVSDLKRDQVKYNGNIISTHDLLQGTTDYTGEGKLLTEARIVDTNTITKTKYKYIFPVKEFKYNASGRVEIMKFECKRNTNYDRDDE